jgi:hypothetical protein
MTGREPWFGAFAERVDSLAFWWLRRRYPKGVTVMETPGMQWALKNYEKLSGPERS